MTRDSTEFSVAVVVGALGGAALALALRSVLRDSDGTGASAIVPSPALPRRIRARAIRLPAGARGFLGRPPRR